MPSTSSSWRWQSAQSLPDVKKFDAVTAQNAEAPVMERSARSTTPRPEDVCAVGPVLTRSKSEERFAYLEKMLDSEGSVQDSKYLLHKSRLPVDSPYVGTFHRGYKLCKRKFLEDASHKDLQLARCPFIDNTMFDCGPPPSHVALQQKTLHDALAAGGQDELGAEVSGVKAQSAYAGATSSKDEVRADEEQGASADDKASGAVTPVMTFEKGPPPSPSASWRSPVPVGDMADVNLSPLMSRRRQFCRKRSLSFSNVRTMIESPVKEMPASPELCGVQALLPRKSGLRVQTKIGEGSFGKIVLAVNTSNHQGTGSGRFGKASRIIHKLPNTGIEVVLKCIKKTTSSEESACLEREVLIHGRVDHVNVPRMYGYYEDEQNLTLILDKIAGQELKQFLMIRRTMPEAEARLVCLQVARALEHLHSMRVVHRDVSPRNILIGDGNKAWLIDLGLAVDLDAQEASAIAPAGTIGYMPPEAQDRAALSTAQDMWALGIILYEMMFGFSPFLPHELHMPVLDVPFPDPSWGLSASEEVKQVMTSLLCKNAGERMTSLQLLAHVWVSEEAVAAMDALFASEMAERAEEKRVSAREKDADRQLLLSAEFGGGSGCAHGGGATALACATLLPRTASIEEEMQDAMGMDDECQSLTALWSAVAWSSSQRWAALPASYPSPKFASPGLYSSPKFASPGLRDAHGRAPSPLSSACPAGPPACGTPSFGSLACLRRSNSETDLPLPAMRDSL